MPFVTTKKLYALCEMGRGKAEEVYTTVLTVHFLI